MGRALGEKQDNIPKVYLSRKSFCKTLVESGLRHLTHRLGCTEDSKNPNPNFDESGWGYCTEEQLEELLLKSLESSYNETIKKLVSMGYDEDIVLKAILRNGHCYGPMDARSNIVHNTLTYLTSGGSTSTSSENDSTKKLEDDTDFVDLKQLEMCSLGAMVYLLQQVKPHLSKGDAMWCLLMSDLHVGRASGIQIPQACAGCGSSNTSDNSSTGVGVVPPPLPPLCKFHSDWCFKKMNEFLSHASETSLQREIVCPKGFNLTPSMKALLKRNVAMFAAGFRTNSKESQVDDDDSAKEEDSSKNSKKNQEMVNMMLNKFKDMNLDVKMDSYSLSEDEKDEMLLGICHQIRDLEAQLKERKEWANQKALQAARKLSQDLTELKILRMERDEIQRLKSKQGDLDMNNEDPKMMSRVKEMDIEVKRANVEVDRATVAKKELENANMELRAEMEAFKLNASESMKNYSETLKRDRKRSKRLLALEKQKTKLQEEIAAEKQMIVDVDQELARVKADQKVAEAKWRQAQKDKEEAQAQVDEERRLKETVEASAKRKDESLRLKIDIDFKRHKDDLQRLEQELSYLKSSSESADSTPTPTPKGRIHHGQTIKGLIQELDDLDGDDVCVESYNRKCLICRKHEVCVVFLPCAHQVLCSYCNERYGKKGRSICPCCRVPIEQRIRVFGATS